MNVKLDNKTSRITTNNVRNHIFIANNCDFLAANAFCKLKKKRKLQMIIEGILTIFVKINRIFIP